MTEEKTGDKELLQDVQRYFIDTLTTHGPTPRGVDWNSPEAQETRFEMLLKVCSDVPFSITDYGCGYGSLVDYLHRHRFLCRYVGFDMVEEMIAQARKLYGQLPECVFTTNEADLSPTDYTVASGIFNMKLAAETGDWTKYVLRTLDRIDRLSLRGFSFNLLTSYADPEKMRPDLYYADPCFYFDWCKQRYARNVALLHDYGTYDFTIIVRKG